MAETALLIKELIAMDISIYEILFVVTAPVAIWKAADIIRAIKD